MEFTTNGDGVTITVFMRNELNKLKDKFSGGCYSRLTHLSVTCRLDKGDNDGKAKKNDRRTVVMKGLVAGLPEMAVVKVSNDFILSLSHAAKAFDEKFKGEIKRDERVKKQSIKTIPQPEFDERRKGDRRNAVASVYPGPERRHMDRGVRNQTAEQGKLAA